MPPSNEKHTIYTSYKSIESLLRCKDVNYAC